MGSQHALGLYVRAVHLACSALRIFSVSLLGTELCPIFHGLVLTVLPWYFCRFPPPGYEPYPAQLCGVPAMPGECVTQISAAFQAI